MAIMGAQNTKKIKKIKKLIMNKKENNRESREDKAVIKSVCKLYKTNSCIQDNQIYFILERFVTI